MAKLTPTLKLRIGDNLDADALYNLYRIDTLGASGLFDSNGNLTLRSNTDILLRPGNGSAGRVLSNHRLTEFGLETDTFTLNDDVTFSGSWVVPWANISKSGASVTDFSDFDTEVSNNSDVSLSTDHRNSTSNPHSTTAAQVGAYTIAQTDTLLSNKANSVHSHIVADITDFSAGVAAVSQVSDSVAHAANTSIHFTKSSISHTEIQDIGSHTHAQIDSHINSNANPHGVTASQVGADTSAQVTTKVSNHAALTSTHGVSGAIVGTSDTQSLTNKTIDASLNTISAISNTSIASNAAIAGSKIDPNFGNQVIKTLDGIEFEEGGYKVKLQAAQSGMAADFVLQLPVDAGSNGQVLFTNGAGETGWTTVAGSTSLVEGSIRIGDATDEQADTDTILQGDVLASSVTGLTIKSGVITNTHINASAAIALSKLATVTSSRALESNGSGVITASSVTSTELGYVSGVTSSIQTQINAKEASLGTPAGDNYVLASTTGNVRSWTLIADANVASGAAIAVNKLAAVTASRALVSSASGFVSASAVTSTELGYLTGLSQNVQTALSTISVPYKTDWLVADGLTKVVTHSLGTRDVVVQLYDAVTYETIYADSVVRTDTNTVTLTIPYANSNTIRVLIIKVP